MRWSHGKARFSLLNVIAIALCVVKLISPMTLSNQTSAELREPRPDGRQGTRPRSEYQAGMAGPGPGSSRTQVIPGVNYAVWVRAANQYGYRHVCRSSVD